MKTLRLALAIAAILVASSRIGDALEVSAEPSGGRPKRLRTASPKEIRAAGVPMPDGRKIDRPKPMTVVAAKPKVTDPSRRTKAAREVGRHLRLLLELDGESGLRLVGAKELRGKAIVSPAVFSHALYEVTDGADALVAESLPHGLGPSHSAAGDAKQEKLVKKTTPLQFSAVVPDRRLGANLASLHIRVYRIESAAPPATIDERTVSRLRTGKGLQLLGHLPGDRLVAELRGLQLSTAPASPTRESPPRPNLGPTSASSIFER